MKKLSITFGNGLYFGCFASQSKIIQLSDFNDAWWSKEPKEIDKCMEDIKKLFPDAKLGVVSHEPQPYTN